MDKDDSISCPQLPPLHNGQHPFTPGLRRAFVSTGARDYSLLFAHGCLSTREVQSPQGHIPRGPFLLYAYHPFLPVQPPRHRVLDTLMGS